MDNKKSEAAGSLLALRTLHVTEHNDLPKTVRRSIIAAIIIIALSLWLAYSDIAKVLPVMTPLVLGILGFFLPFIVGLLHSRFTVEGRARKHRATARAERYKTDFLKFMQDFYRVDINALDQEPSIDYVHEERLMRGSHTSYVTHPNILLNGRFKVNGRVLDAKFERLGGDIILMHDGAEIQPFV